MKRILPPLNSLRAFEATARHHSIVGAAEEMNVSPGAISRHVKNLEEFIGNPLFRRTKNGLILTKTGMAYATLTRDVFDSLHEGTLRVRGESIRSTVKLRVTPTVAIRWLMPRLAPFYGSYPDIDVQITTAYAPVDFDRDDADLGIRLGANGWPELESRWILDEALLPICLDNMKDQRIPDRPEDLSSNVLLHSLMRPNDWQTWSRTCYPSLDYLKGVRFENSVMAYQAVQLGMGVALTHNPCFFATEIAHGHIVAPFGIANAVATGNAYYVVRPKRRTLKGPVKLLWDWLVEHSHPIMGN